MSQRPLNEEAACLISDSLPDFTPQTKRLIPSADLADWGPSRELNPLEVDENDKPASELPKSQERPQG